MALLLSRGPDKDQQQMQNQGFHKKNPTTRRSEGEQMDSKEKKRLDYSPRIYFLDSVSRHLVLLNKKSPTCLLLHEKTGSHVGELDNTDQVLLFSRKHSANYLIFCYFLSSKSFRQTACPSFFWNIFSIFCSRLGSMTACMQNLEAKARRGHGW